jgi:hypothetical protein
MPISPLVTGESLKFVQISDQLSQAYANDLAGWTGSPFAWILSLPSRTRGAIGEQLVAEWLSISGFAVTRSGHSGCDRVVNGVNFEIKFSTLWKSGGYTFQQLRDQDYAHALLLGVSPQAVNAWVVPKAEAWKHGIPQHGGAAGKDTRWITFPADGPPGWIAQYGGSLEQALAVLRRVAVRR